MSSEMKPQLRCMSRRRTVLVLPVSVWADMTMAPRFGVDRRAVEQDEAARHEPEPQQRLDHVRVQDVVRPVSSQFASIRPARRGDVEGGRQGAEVLAVADDAVAALDRRDVQARPAAESRRRITRSGSTGWVTLNAASSGRLTVEVIRMRPWTSYW